MTRYPKPWRQAADSWEVVDANGRYVCLADSATAAAEIVNLANTSHAAAENSRRFLERGKAL